MNDLSVRIGADVAPAVAGLQEVSARLRNTAKSGEAFSESLTRSANTATESLKKLKPGSKQATNSLIDLSRVAQDAPYGFLAIANNLNPLLESFQRLRVSTGSTSGALSALKSALLGPAGLGLALGVVSSLIVSFGDKLFSAKASMNDYQKVVSEAKDEFVKMFASLSQAQNNIDLVKRGLVSQQSALEQYNSTIGKVAGSANTWAEAEQKIINQGDAVVEVTLKKAAANIAYAKAGEAAFKLQELQYTQKQFEANEGSLPAVARAAFRQKIKESLASATREISKFKEMANNLLAEAGTITKNNGLLFAPELETKASKVTVKPDKFEIDRPAIGSVQSELPSVLVKSKVDRSATQKGIDDISKELNRTLPTIDIPATPRLPKNTGAEKLTEQLLELKEIAEKVGESIADVFGNAFEAMLKGEDVVKSIGEGLRGLIIDIGKAIIKLVVLKTISSIVPGLGALIPFRASGGAVSGGSPYVVGERGPELFIPASTGRIEPNGRGSFGQGGIMINLSGQFVQRGSDLIATISQVQQSQRRLS
jgi:uncharacterized phage infection (PIP) family protein YhgE